MDRRLVAEQAMATAKEAQHDAAESIFGAIIAVLDKHEHEHTLTPGFWSSWPARMRQWLRMFRSRRDSGPSSSSEPRAIGDQRGANLDVVQGALGTRHGGRYLGSICSWLIQGR
jgi:hypothetical protein